VRDTESKNADFFEEPKIMNATDQTAMNGRIQNGTFAPGNKATAGRSSRAVELRRAFVDAVSVEDIQAIASALVKSAKDGDISAAKLVLDRLGKVDPVADEIQQRDRENSIGRLLEMARARQSELARNSKDAVMP
jgi:hypothetical protein